MNLSIFFNSSFQSMETFLEDTDIILSSFVKKPINRANIAKTLWKLSGQDTRYANYLVYEVFADYLASPKLEDIVTSIKQNHVGWKHPDFQQYEDQQNEYDAFLTNPPELEEGVIQCSRCGSKKTFSFSKQTRRADESATVFVRCVECGKSFRM
jgi:DNA-directed RNA polymerase subunit M/transcription elongation factor TFIIS